MMDPLSHHCKGVSRCGGFDAYRCSPATLRCKLPSIQSYKAYLQQHRFHKGISKSICSHKRQLLEICPSIAHAIFITGQYRTDIETPLHRKSPLNGHISTRQHQRTYVLSTPAFGTIQSIGPLKLRLAGVEVVFTMLLYGLGDLYVGWQKVVIEQVLNLHPLVHVMYC